MCAHTDEKVKEIKALTADICEHCTQDCRKRLLIMDSVVDDLRGAIHELGRVVDTLRRGIDELRALWAIITRVCNIFNAPEKRKR